MYSLRIKIFNTRTMSSRFNRRSVARSNRYSPYDTARNRLRMIFQRIRRGRDMEQNGEINRLQRIADNIPPNNEGAIEEERSGEVECSICLDDIDNNGYNMDVCPVCRKCFHNHCLNRWFTTQANQRQPLNCPMCRSIIA